ncbi:MAG TPA: glycosyltransferase family 39 protein, partial [Saprospiraceae bacterium]|nr:glycosyltransferase family 39 protein [Saprospiraceae bacterium]
MSSRSQIFLFLWLILGALYLTHLGVIPVQATGDECRRALVPLEMRISGDYLKPTINGELYLNKPPLYNWLVAGFYSLGGGYSPFALRLPVVLSILAHGFLIFWVCRRYTSETVAGL